MTLVKRNNYRTTFPTFNDVVADLFSDVRNVVGHDRFNSSVSTNILEDENGYGLEVAAPGLKKEDFKIDLEENLLTISADVKEEETEVKRNFRRREFGYQQFSRSFRLPDTINQDEIQAKYEGGILKLFLPFREDVKAGPRKITIQ